MLRKIFALMNMEIAVTDKFMAFVITIIRILIVRSYAKIPSSICMVILVIFDSSLSPLLRWHSVFYFSAAEL